MTALEVAAGAAIVLLVAAVGPGGVTYLLAVLIATAVALVALSAALAGTGHRPVLIAAAVAGLGSPLWAHLQPDAQLAPVAVLTAAALLGAFVLLIVARRRQGITIAVGATAMIGVLTGLGGAALVLLRGPDGGLAWAGALLALVLVPEVVATIVTRLGRPDVAGPARYVSYGVVAGGVVGLLSPPLTIVATAVFLAVAGAAQLGGITLGAALAAPSQPQRWLLSTLLAAPVAFLALLVLQT